MQSDDFKKRLRANEASRNAQKAMEETRNRYLSLFEKKIRDDQGYWEQLESYLDRHSDVKFSHGICQDCMKKHYPEFCDERHRGEGGPFP